MGTSLVRGALVVLTLLVAAWLIVSYRDVELQQQAETLARQDSLSPADVNRARDLLHRSRSLRADVTPLVNESLMLLGVGRKREADVIARRVTALEPDNVDAWFVAYGTALRRARTRQALDQIRRLNPWAADALR
jgi:hypothetical protein